MLLNVLFLFIASTLVTVQGSVPICPHKLEPIGCFKDNAGSRTLPEQIVNERDIMSKVHNGNLINWKEYETYLPQFMCRCALKAFQKGYTVIGIQFWGECWSGPNAAIDYNKYGSADSCSTSKFNEDFVDTTKCQAATGKQWTNYVYRIAPSSCSTMYTPIGCYRDSLVLPRPLPNYISSDRDYSIKVFSGKLIDWQNWNTYSPEMICRCAKLAKSKGDTYFGIQFWGECWSGSTSADYSRDGISQNCRGKDFKECSCNSYHCVGKAHTNYVYRLKTDSLDELMELIYT